MDFTEYQLKAARTMPLNDSGNNALLLWSVALAGEVGEFCNAVKKAVGHGHNHLFDELPDELGDTLWYVSALATLLGIDLGKIAEQNIEKLQARYPNGFSVEDSLGRAEYDG